MSSISVNLNKIKDSLNTVQGDVATVQGDVATVQGDVATVQGDVATVQGDVATVQGDIATVQGSVDNHSAAPNPHSDSRAKVIFLEATTVTIPGSSTFTLNFQSNHPDSYNNVFSFSNEPYEYYVNGNGYYIATNLSPNPNNIQVKIMK